MDRAYSTYARARLTQEAQILDWQDELRTAQAATSFDERKATQLAGNVSGAENKIATAYLKARGEALAALTPAQRTQLEKIATENRPIRDDKYRFLLLSQVEDLWRSPIDPEVGQALVSAAGAASAAGAGAPRSAPVQQNITTACRPRTTTLSTATDSVPDSGGMTSTSGLPLPFMPARTTSAVIMTALTERGNFFGNNRYNDYNRIDRNARPRWDRSDNGSRPPSTFTSPIPQSPEPRRPLYSPSNPSDRGTSGGFSRPTAPQSRPEPPATPQWERQRETPRQPERRPDPPRVDPPRSSGGSSDGGSRWNRGGGGRGR
jgi:hypothetical protein